jgi:hypothetical protein
MDRVPLPSSSPMDSAQTKRQSPNLIYLTQRLELCPSGIRHIGRKLPSLRAHTIVRPLCSLSGRSVTPCLASLARHDRASVAERRFRAPAFWAGERYAICIQFPFGVTPGTGHWCASPASEEC